MSDIVPSYGEWMRQHERAALRDERDAALAENKRLRVLYENVTGNRERFGWTINHLLECEETLRCAEERESVVVAERDSLQREVERLTHLARTLRQALIVNREASSTTNVSNGATRRAEQITSHAIGLAGEALSEPDPDARATTTDGD